jgi:beta-glucosidase-like glycosyl hydrolase
MQLGMLDPPTLNPYNYVSNSSEVVESAEHLALALQAAREALCLYQNRNGALPLDASRLRTVAVVGPQGPQTTLLLGNYARTPDAGIVSLLDGLAAVLGERNAASCSLLYVQRFRRTFRIGC